MAQRGLDGTVGSLRKSKAMRERCSEILYETHTHTSTGKPTKLAKVARTTPKTMAINFINSLFWYDYTR